ncbi:MAG TPA: DUF2007 domain-containing protein [Acidiferrobacterales bacterium]|nr:DUF2007 domain-containing protein [Acidiferrobacterales bacterium]
MQRIYQAENIIDAHLIKGLLEQHGIAAYVGGYYLQGGVGETLVDGFASVSVDERDIAAAQAIIEDYDNGKFMLDDDEDMTKPWKKK